MKRNKLRVGTLLLCLLFLGSVGFAEQDEVSKTVFSASGKRLVAEIPVDYLIYTPELGQDSPLLAFTGMTTKDLNDYLNALQCVLCAVHKEKQHQLWISINDRSDAFSKFDDEPSTKARRAYYDGLSLSRGQYSEYERNGTFYYLFADNPSINDNGRSLYLSFFINKEEVSVRWESGNGKCTHRDILDVQNIAESIKTEEQDKAEQKAAADRKAGLVVTESNLFFNEQNNTGYFFAKVENHGQFPAAFGSTRFAVYDTNNQLIYENSYTDSSPMFALIDPGDYIYVSFERMWDVYGLKSNQIGRVEFQPEPYDYSVQFNRIPCEATFNLTYDYGYLNTNLQVILENKTNELIKSPQLVYAFYDRKGQLAKVGNQYLSEITIFPDSKIMIEPFVDSDAISYLVENNQTPETVVAMIYYEP